jgi:hypothetical protein
VRRKIDEIAPGWYQQPAIHGRVRFRVSATKAFLDLFTICREHGVFLDREMVRFIRSIFFVDGLVSRLASSVDLADKLRNAVEMWSMSEARRKVSSAGAALALMTDGVLWARTGPGGVLRSLEALEKRGHGILTASSGPDPAARGRVRTLAIAAVWVVMAPAVAFGNLSEEWKRAPIQAVLGALVVLAWTAWLAYSVRRPAVNQP